MWKRWYRVKSRDNHKNRCYKLKKKKTRKCCHRTVIVTVFRVVYLNGCVSVV